MRTYYTKGRARSYNRRWKVFSERTHVAISSVIDFDHLEKICKAGEQPRILDAACGTGLLLQRLLDRVPCAKFYGVDASLDMLAQARQAFKGKTQVQFLSAYLRGSEKAGLPYEAASFDLITCANALHNLQEPLEVLQGLAELLKVDGQCVIEDYARRGFPFPWRIFEWFTRLVDPQHVRAYTLEEALEMCQKVGLRVTMARNFPVNTVWSGWVIYINNVRPEDRAV